MRTLIAISLLSLFILSSCELKEEPVESSTNGTAASVTVTLPNGGESIMEGSSYNIKWTATNVTLISIQFSFDNGSSWYLIADSVENKGVYSWFPVPNLISNQCKIRISSNDGSGADESDLAFAIIKNSSQSLKMVSPAGGESWEGGSAKEIKWFSSGLDSVKIEYTTDNGNHWNFIAVDKKNTGIFYWDPLPNTPSTLTKVRIMDASDGYPSTESPATFNILPEPKLRVIRPNGGETLLSAGTRKIEWISENIENVKIAYSTDNGAKWNTIIESTPSIGFYTWESIPNLVSQNCKIKVYDAKDGQPNDESDSVFTITNQITQIVEVETPNGGEKWQAGTAQNITWNSSGVTQVKIEYTTNNGIEWNLIIDQLPNTGAYEWNVPNSLSTQCLIRISDSQDGNPVDQSNSRFSIVPKPELKILSPNGGEAWAAGQIDTIKWYSVGIENVSIDYSTDNGNIWKEIVTSTESDGEYSTSFTVPGNQYKIKIKNVENDTPIDESDGTFIVTDEPVISVLIPNGGEEWFSGSRDNIRWSSTNIEDVKLEYTTNNGASWNLINSSVPSNGVYSWNPIPNVSSALCKIKVSDAKDGIPSDISDENFTINNVQLIEVKSPNGKEEWASGSRQDITWNTTGVANVKIEYTTNNGINWLSIVESTPSDGFYTWENVPSTASTNCKIRISDASDGSPSDDSDQFFSIIPEPSIKVLSPNGTESWLTGTNQLIRWTSENVANVKIELTTDGGANWITIIESVISTGSYKWDNIPDINSLQCKIRISDADDNTPFDLSDNNFEITNQIIKSLQVLSPNGGEDFEAGSKQNITWSSSGIEKVKIELTTNKGSNWTILADSVSGGAFEWEISENVNSPQCQIRITDIEDIKISDVSDGSFTISPKKWIVVTGPQTKIYKSNEPIVITWQSGGIKNVGIKYTTTNGVADLYNPAFTNLAVVGAAVGSYTTYFSKPSDKYFVVVYNADEGANATPSNNSPGFTIIKAETPEIKVVKPNGGEEWYAGANDNIQWTSTNVENVKIEYSTNSGASWTLITNNTPSNGVYAWNPIPNVFSQQCRIKVSNALDGSLSDVSDSNFAILYGNQMVTVTSPNGGESWAAGSRQYITWESTGITNVKIDYTTNNGINWIPVVNSTPSDGFYTWDLVDSNKVPIVSATTTNCKIRISDAADNAPSDESNQFFTIEPEPYVEVSKPNGGEIWLTGTSQVITWTSENVANVKIEYSTDAGGNWNMIVNSTPSIGYYAWNNIPNVNSLQCRIRISDADDGAPFDLSDDNFQISNQVVQSITVLVPNGGEKWQAGTSKNIVWDSKAVTAVNIDFSTNNGLSWTPVVTNYSSSGSYEWNPIPSVNSSQCMIRIKDATDGTPVDESNSTFSIQPVQTLQVTYPYSGVELVAGQKFNLQWTSVGIEYVKIEYNPKNSDYAPDWVTLTDSVPSNGTYEMSFSIASDNYAVRISDAADGTPVAKVGPFKVKPAPYVQILAPNGNEQWITSKVNASVTDVQNYHPYEIKWNATNMSKVRIEWSTNGGGSWYTVPGAESTENDGSFVWAPGRLDSPRPDSSDNCRVRISSADVNVSATDETDGFFSIHSSKKIRINTPNGGEYFYLTAKEREDPKTSERWPLSITWTSYAISTDVKIYYSLQNGAEGTWIELVTVPSTGIFGWDYVFGTNADSISTSSTLLRIKVVDAADSKIWDTNDGPVNINVVGGD